ncbi:hypothetical protein FEV53_15920 [Palleronia caenipelagi]|uniref:Uncharacterized protein n=1 Tax=Palleronia caenipelagi TaxID=2489174 RepID=A0A547PN49_9RHOB|nr:hypothetical protein FEV53_15920 [Palleronia caenipelagi]
MNALREMRRDDVICDTNLEHGGSILVKRAQCCPKWILCRMTGHLSAFYGDIERPLWHLVGRGIDMSYCGLVQYAGYAE